jgi:hypothetical protein
MYNPAGQTCYQGFNDLALAKAKDLHLERSTDLRSNPNFVQHQMRWYPAYDRLHYFWQCKTQTGWMKAVRHILQTDQVVRVLRHKCSPTLNP